MEHTRLEKHKRHTRLQGGVRVVVSLNGFNGACGVRQKKNKNDKKGERCWSLKEVALDNNDLIDASKKITMYLFFY